MYSGKKRDLEFGLGVEKDPKQDQSSNTSVTRSNALT